MKQCLVCNRIYDDSWGICLNDNAKLIDQLSKDYDPSKRIIVVPPSAENRLSSMRWNIILFTPFVSAIAFIIYGFIVLSMRTKPFGMGDDPADPTGWITDIAFTATVLPVFFVGSFVQGPVAVWISSGLTLAIMTISFAGIGGVIGLIPGIIIANVVYYSKMRKK